MTRHLLFLLLIPTISFGQQQIGQTINHITPSDLTGQSVAISTDGNIITVGSCYNDTNGVKDSGTVRVFRNVTGTWTQIGQDVNGTLINGHFGNVVSMSADGKTFASVSFNSNSNLNYVQIYRNVSGNWVQLGNTILSQNNNLSGSGNNKSIALSADGNTIVVGEPTSIGNANVPGKVRVFQNISGNWTQLGQDIDGKTTSARSGQTVAMHPNGNIIAFVSLPTNTQQEYISVYYLNTAGSWVQLGTDFYIPRDTNRTSFDPRATSISLASTEDNIILAIGSPHASNKSSIYSIGIVQVYKYEYLASVWTQIGANITAPSLYSAFGYRVCLSSNGKRVAISANAGKALSSDPGSFVQVYENKSGNWAQIASTISGWGNESTDSGDIALSGDGDKIVVGFRNSPAHYVRVYDLTKPASTNQFVLDNFNVFPNPVKDVLNVSLENELILEKIMMYNNLGQLVKETEHITIDVSNLAKGIYFVEVQTNQGKGVKKVILK